MIMIKAPIELKVRTDLMRGYDSFGERIAGNYALMGLEVGEEELLHMVNSPPEIYLADAGSATIGGNTFISSRNEEKYNIVNNMLNRILLSVNGELTYQDRIYITDALYKLGIRDDRKFMSQVQDMIHESHLEEAFLNNYFDLVVDRENRELRQQTLEMSKELVEKYVYDAERVREDTLSESILHRLQTGAIYQIVSNFNKSLSDTRVELQESMISEQENVARKLLVQNFVSNIVREEPEMFHRVEETGTAGDGEREILQQGTYGREERPGEILREEREFRTDHSERVYRESEETRTERESLRESEHTTAEIVYRREDATEGAPEEGSGTLQERVIVERERTTEPGITEHRTTEEIRTEQQPGTDERRSEEIGSVPSEQEGVIIEKGGSERITERVTEAGTSVTERTELQQSTERIGQYVTEQGEVLRTEHAKSELVFREGESREEHTETILDRRSEQLTEERDRITQRQDTETLIRERTEAVPGTEVRTESESEQLIRETETTQQVSGDVLSGSVSERVTEGESRITEQTEREQIFDHTDRYVTEQGEILRTELEGADIIYREAGTAGAEGSEEAAQQTLRETLRTELEQIRETGETAPGQEMVETTTDRILERTDRVTERPGSEVRTTEQRTLEQGRETLTEKERTEVLHETDRERLESQETLTEKERQQLTAEQRELREHTETAFGTERTETYVTEQGEILRTEHAGEDLIYREEGAAASAEQEAAEQDTLRESVRLELERIREAGETLPGQGVSERITEQIRETERSITERPGSEVRTTEQRTVEQEGDTLTERERTEVLHETDREHTASRETLTERERQQLTAEQRELRERTEAAFGTEQTETYVTEQGEILRTEHAGEDLIYREEGAAATAEQEAAIQETLRESVRSELERIRETGETLPGQGVSERTTEQIRETERSITERPGSEVRTTEQQTLEQGRDTLTERERSEILHERERERISSTETLTDRERQQLIHEQRELTERRDTEYRTEASETYVTETGGILRTEHAGEDLIYREEGAAASAEQEAAVQETLRETVRSELERIREAGEAISGQGVSERTEERIRESERSITERPGSEIRTTEQRTLEQGRETLTEKDRTQVLRETDRERISSTETLTDRERQQLINEQRELTERIGTEYRTEASENYVTEAGEILRTEHEGTELIFREGAETRMTEESEGRERDAVREILESKREQLTERERLERERSRSESRESLESSVRSELREQLRTERLRTQGAAGRPGEDGRTYERTERIFREEGVAAESAPVETPGRSIRETERYRSDNIYERELLEKEKTKTEVTEGLTSAVLLDVVKTLFHAGYERITKGDTWIEYRGALYHSAENTFNRLNVNLEEGSETLVNIRPEITETVNTEQVDFTDLHEVTEDVQDVAQIEQTIREMNEMNLQNVERYQQMVQTLKEIRPEKKRTGGIERTRQEALSLLDDEQALYESMSASENAQEEERREVFHEITRLFPDRSVEIFKVVEQYLENPEHAAGVGVTRNNVEAAAEEIRRITSAPVTIAEPMPEPMQTESTELVFRRNDRVTQEELQEVMESFRRSQELQRREIEQREQQMETDRRNTYTVTTNTARTLSRQQTEDIEALVSRGVRSQMGAISEQVLQKLEKKLKNEKIRRGI